MKDLILLHGAIGAKDQLQSLAHELSSSFTTHTLNFAGHGGESFLKEKFSIPFFAQQIVNYIREHQLEKPQIFGYSMGGYAGMYLVRYYPQLAGKLITLATKYEWSEAIAAKEIKMLDTDTIIQKVPRFAKQLEDRHAPNNWKEVVNRSKQLLIDLGNQPALTHEDFAAISTDCLLMSGDRDNMVVPEETLSVYRKISSAQFAILPATAHPIDQVDVQLISFMVRRFIC